MTEVKPAVPRRPGRSAKARSLACRECRDRKIRCDGARPVCDSCSKRGLNGDQCRYPEIEHEGSIASSRSYIRVLQKRVEELEAKEHQACHALLAQGHNAFPSIESPQGTTWVKPFETTQAPRLNGLEQSVLPPLHHSDPNYPPHGLFGATSVPSMTRGAAHYYSRHSAQMETSPPLTDDLEDFSPVKASFGSYSTNSKAALMLGKISLPPTELMDEPMRDYFDLDWITMPLVHKPSFINKYDRLIAVAHSRYRRDIPLPEATELAATYCLLFGILALGELSKSGRTDVGTSESGNGAEFHQQARALLLTDLISSPSLLVVQALLVHARFLRRSGSSQESWVYVGLAHRLAEGLLLHVEIPGKSNAEQEERRRIWCACVFMIRMQGNCASTGYPSYGRLPQEVDDEYLETQVRNVDSTQPPDTPSAVSFFVHGLKLSDAVLQPIQSFFFSSKDNGSNASVSEILSTTLRLDSELWQWYCNLPEHLQVENISDQRNPVLSRQVLLMRMRHLEAKTLLYRATVTKIARTSPSKFMSDLTKSLVSTIVDSCYSTSVEFMELVGYQNEFLTNAGPPESHVIISLCIIGMTLNLLLEHPFYSDFVKSTAAYDREIRRCLSIVGQYNGSRHPVTRKFVQLFRDLVQPQPQPRSPLSSGPLDPVLVAMECLKTHSASAEMTMLDAWYQTTPDPTGTMGDIAAFSAREIASFCRSYFSYWRPPYFSFQYLELYSPRKNPHGAVGRLGGQLSEAQQQGEIVVITQLFLRLASLAFILFAKYATSKVVVPFDGGPPLSITAAFHVIRQPTQNLSFEDWAGWFPGQLARQLATEPDSQPAKAAVMTVTKAETAGEGLGDRALLDKMDKLRDLGISAMVPLPQMVVVGDQSAGKSSVLESLTGFHFPRSVSLCTRHATEIICRREERENVVVSIHAVDADEDKAKAFRHETSSLDDEAFAHIFEKAAVVMGLKTQTGEDQPGVAFSRDILRVEISGPKKSHLTVIDVPGMFENDTPGKTTKDDVRLVKEMVKGYINEPRTIILAVVPCNVDIATQKILTLANEADPKGQRTLGVLTKPDLATEKAVQNRVVNIVMGKEQGLQLGYCLVKNRSADDEDSSAEERNRQEKEFFSQAPWTKLPADRLGIPALTTRVEQLLTDRTKSEFPKVRSELNARRKTNEASLKDMGQTRITTEEQRIYLGKIAVEFSKIKDHGLDAYYTRHKVFENPDLKLITRIREINERFSAILYEKGHTRKFVPNGLPGVDATAPKRGPESSDGADSSIVSDISDRNELYDDQATFKIPTLGEDELDGILSEMYHCDDPAEEDIMEYIEREYLTSRGYELGTFSGEMLPTTFKEQSKKWEPITLAHVSNAILVVHHFIHTVLQQACPDENVRQELWEFLLEELQKRYKRAMDHAAFLIKVELQAKSITYNPVFDDALAKTRTSGSEDQLKMAHEIRDRYKEKVEYYEAYGSSRKTSGDVVNAYKESLGILDKFTNALTNNSKQSNLKTTRREIHNVLQTFYDISRSRFVDVICQQVIDHFLLHADDSPLMVFSSSAVMEMSSDQLATIAGEDTISRNRREKLTRDIDDLSKALKILKG
ncbi:hypothetical protein G7046_g50 [Stylonectria norvegica]|nr:hypothetical protein G7046_g50 [Stylonectria norvegica]